jgi:outer membrane immunogenic protein
MSKSFRPLSALAAALMLTAAPAVAGDFTGFYAGVQLGDTFGDADSSQNTALGDPLTTSQADYKFSSLSGGVHAGYNHPFNDFTLGAVFDANLMDITDSDEEASSATRDDNKLEIASILSLSAKGGWRALPGTLVYAKAGYSWANADASIERTVGVVSTAEKQSIDFSGFSYGLGASFSIADSTTLGLEWRHYSFGSEQVAFEGTNNEYDLGFDPDMDTIELSVSYFFSGPLN